MYSVKEISETQENEAVVEDLKEGKSSWLRGLFGI